jgi:outer membrane protein TolC
MASAAWHTNLLAQNTGAAAPITSAPMASAVAGRTPVAQAPDLPPQALARSAILDHPNVATARAGVAVEEATRRRLTVGPYETGVRVGAASRHDAAAGRNLSEWDVMVERPVRLGAKSALDARLGEQAVEQARLAVGDARHETGRTLLRLWFAWTRAAAASQRWGEQRDLLARQAQVVARRTQLGDAARQEALLADAALAQAEAAWAGARTREQVARSELARSFPGLPLPAQAPPADALPVEHDAAWWEARITEHNHELALARAEVERRRTAAERARAERTPDPTVGVRYASERAGNERVLGLVLAIPIGGAARAAGADQAAAQIDVARARAATIERRLAAEAAATFATADRAYQTWRQAQAAAQALQKSAALTARAHALGEASLSDVLTAQRLAIEAQLGAEAVRFDAAEARHRLALDGHQIWDFDDD